MPIKGGRLTPQERKFAETYAVTQDPVYSATKAGYGSAATKGYAKINNPAVQDQVRRVQVARMNNHLLPMALDLIEAVLTDVKETTRNRLTAAKLVVDRTIGMGGDAGDDKEPHEMTPAELQARIDRLRREQADRAQPIIEHEPAPQADEPEGGVFG